MKKGRKTDSEGMVSKTFPLSGRKVNEVSEKTPWKRSGFVIALVLVLFLITSSCKTIDISAGEGTSRTYAHSKDAVFKAVLAACEVLNLNVTYNADDHSGFVAYGQEKVMGQLTRVGDGETQLVVSTQPKIFGRKVISKNYAWPIHRFVGNRLGTSTNESEFSEGGEPSNWSTSQSKRDEDEESSRVPARWAVVIGISAYADSRIPSLRYAEADAASFYKWLTNPEGGGYPPQRVKRLIGDKATLTNMKKVFFEWLTQTREEDVVCIYFAGHGSPQSPQKMRNLFLLPYDADYKHIASTAFPMSNLERAVNRFIKAERIVILADACHAGGVGAEFDKLTRSMNRGMEVNPVTEGLSSLTESSAGEGTCVFSATGADQLSFEGKKYGGGHGAFTWFLLKGLKGKADFSNDGSVTLGELTSYVTEEVREATDRRQKPTVAGRYDPALPLAAEVRQAHEEQE